MEVQNIGVLDNSTKKYIDKEMTERYNTAIPNDN